MPEWGGDWSREARARWAADVADGAAVCGICRKPIGPGQSWDVDHVVPLAAGGDMRDPTNQRPAHSSCNRSRGATLGNKARATRPRPAPAVRRTAPAATGEPFVWTSPDFAAWVASWRHPTPPTT